MKIINEKDLNVKLKFYTQPNAEEFSGDENIETVQELIAYCARVSNPANQYNNETADKLIKYLIKHKHWSPLEMANAVLEIETTRDIAHQIIRHRSLSFQEFCISGDSLIHTYNNRGKEKEIKISELYNRYKSSNWKKHANLVAVYDESYKEFILRKIKEVFNTGIKPVYRVTLHDGKSIECTKEHKFFTKDGFSSLENLEVGDFVGVNAPEYTISFKRISSIEYVGEMQTYDLEIDHDSHNYVANGIVTHNSQRYSDPVKDLSFVLSEPRLQDNKNRQNSIELSLDNEADNELALKWLNAQVEVITLATEVYNNAINMGIAKEVARKVLPEGLTATRLYINGSIRSWIHYIEARTYEGAQAEHRRIAKACAEAISKIFPMVEDFVLS